MASSLERRRFSPSTSRPWEKLRRPFEQEEPKDFRPRRTSSVSVEDEEIAKLEAELKKLDFKFNFKEPEDEDDEAPKNGIPTSNGVGNEEVVKAPAPTPSGGVAFKRRPVGFKELMNGRKHLTAELCLEVKGLHRPIGLAVFPSGAFAVADTKNDTVKLFNADGKIIGRVSGNFKRPTDMTTMADGRLVIRDDLGGIRLFDEDGIFLKRFNMTAVVNERARCFGLAADPRGCLVYTLLSRFNSAPDLVAFDPKTGKAALRIELEDLIEDPRKSRCRFLHHDGENMFVSDLGVHRVYVVNLETFDTRILNGDFREPAGMAIDEDGSGLLVADAGNHRIQVLDVAKKCVLGFVKTSKPVMRPASIYFDHAEKALYVINLNGNSLTKYNIVMNK